MVYGGEGALRAGSCAPATTTAAHHIAATEKTLLISTTPHLAPASPVLRAARAAASARLVEAAHVTDQDFLKPVRLSRQLRRQVGEDLKSSPNYQLPTSKALPSPQIPGKPSDASVANREGGNPWKFDVESALGVARRRSLGGRRALARPRRSAPCARRRGNWKLTAEHSTMAPCQFSNTAVATVNVTSRRSSRRTARPNVRRARARTWPSAGPAREWWARRTAAPKPRCRRAEDAAPAAPIAPAAPARTEGSHPPPLTFVVVRPAVCYLTLNPP